MRNRIDHGFHGLKRIEEFGIDRKTVHLALDGSPKPSESDI
jgi:hypothetical protein